MMSEFQKTKLRFGDAATCCMRACPVPSRVAAGIVAALAALAALAFSLMSPFNGLAYAQSGSVYACTVHPVYEHPVTGEIEDSGGASSRATGQAMVESCVSSSGMMEITDTGECFLTIRMSLVDMTSGHDFSVQDWGDVGWSSTALGVTAVGSNSSGTTNDVCIQLPSQDGIVRVSMLVESMGRNVVFYVYADSLSEPAPSDFVATIVTEESDGTAAAATLEQSGQGAGTGESEVGAQEHSEGAQAQQASSESAEVAANQAASQAQEAANAGQASAQQVLGTAASGVATASTTAAGADAQAVESADDLVEGAGASTAQGLSLSTALDADEAVAANSDADATDISSADVPFAVRWLSVVGGGIVLMLVAALIAYVFRRNWNRWGGTDPDDYSKEYRRG